MNKIHFLGHPSLEFLIQYAYEIRFQPFGCRIAIFMIHELFVSASNLNCQNEIKYQVLIFMITHVQTRSFYSNEKSYMQPTHDKS